MCLALSPLCETLQVLHRVSCCLTVTEFAFHVSLSFCDKEKCLVQILERILILFPILSYVCLQLPSYHLRLLFFFYKVCAFQQKHICVIFALVKYRLKPVQQDEANANIELQFPFCNRKCPPWAHNNAFPGFILPPCGAFGVQRQWPNLVSRERSEGLRRRRAAKVSVCLHGKRRGKRRHEGRQSLQVRYNSGALPAWFHNLETELLRR